MIRSRPGWPPMATQVEGKWSTCHNAPPATRAIPQKTVRSDRRSKDPPARYSRRRCSTEATRPATRPSEGPPPCPRSRSWRRPFVTLMPSSADARRGGRGKLKLTLQIPEAQHYEAVKTLQKRVAGKAPIDPLAARLWSTGLRVTVQRLGILQVLKTSRGHPTAEDVYRQARKRFPRISLNTVYLNLEALTRAGETSEIWIGHGAARFEANNAPHDHAVCLECKKIVDIHAPALRRLQMPRRLAKRFEVTSHRVDFFGLCKPCRLRRYRNEPRSYRGT